MLAGAIVGDRRPLMGYYSVKCLIKYFEYQRTGKYLQCKDCYYQSFCYKEVKGEKTKRS